MKKLLLVLLASNSLVAISRPREVETEDKRKPVQITTVPFLKESICSGNSPCYKITPDSLGVVTLNSQRQLIYFDVKDGSRKKIADSNCGAADCFAITPDSSAVLFTKLVSRDEMAIYSRSLTNLRRGQAAPLEKVGTLPRFAGTDPINTTYQLSFCGDSNGVFARSSTTDDFAAHGFALNSPTTPRRELFQQKRSTVQEIRCDGSAAYVHASARNPSSPPQAEYIIRSEAKNLSNDSLFREVIYQADAPGDENLIRDFLPNSEGILYAMQSPSTDPVPTSSLLMNVGQPTEKVVTSWDDKTFVMKIIAGSPSAFLIRTQSSPWLPDSAELVSIDRENGTKVRLNQKEFNLSEVASVSHTPGAEKVLFYENRSFDRKLVVSRLNGAQRMEVVSENANTNNGYSGHKITQALLSSNGNCIVTAVRLEAEADSSVLRVLATEHKIQNLFPTENKAMRMGTIRIAPDSSYAIFVANPDGVRKFHLYKIPLPECTL